MFDPRYHQWLHYRWENAQTRRYYEAQVVNNLFNEWEVFCLWCGIGTRLGGSTVIPLNSPDEAQATLAKIEARRTQRHYSQVPALKIEQTLKLVLL
jgi:predicted DNA-binding WGR domain protein